MSEVLPIKCANCITAQVLAGKISLERHSNVSARANATNEQQQQMWRDEFEARSPSEPSIILAGKVITTASQYVDAMVTLIDAASGMRDQTLDDHEASFRVVVAECLGLETVEATPTYQAVRNPTACASLAELSEILQRFDDSY